MNNELVKQETQLPAVVDDFANSSEIVTSDISIPRLLIGQGTSPLVTSRKIRIGDIARSTTGEVLGDPDKPVEIVPILMQSSWTMFETAASAGTNKPAFRGQEPRGAHNSNLPWEYKGENGEEMFRKKTITLYAIVPSDIEQYEAELKRCEETGDAPDLARTLLPVVITIMGTAFKHGGKKCADFFNNVRTNAQRIKGLVPYKYSLKLISKEVKDGEQSWFVCDFSAPTKCTNPAAIAEAAKWSAIIAKGQVKVEGEEEAEPTRVESSNVGELEV